MITYITLSYVMITYNDVMEADNPFVYGEIVTAAAFADREDERDRLGRDLAAGQKVFLISPRRYGKSSLVRDVMRGLARQKILTVEVTVASSSSYVGFLESYAQALVAADTPVGRLRRWAGELLRAIRPELRFDADTSRPRRKLRARLSRRSAPARDAARARRRSVRAARPHCRGAQAAPGHRARRVPGHYVLRRRHASSTRCAPRCRTSGRSATCSPAPSRR